MKKREKSWALKIDFVPWLSGELWNWYVLPAIEFSQWQERKYACTAKHTVYKSAWFAISFLKMRLQIGISYTPPPYFI